MMSDILVRNGLCLDGRRRSVLIEEGRIVHVKEGKDTGSRADRIIEANRLLMMPGLCNAHTHTPMSLLRGVGEDMELKRWLKERIWPIEARMETRHLKAGMALGCLEMVRTGTTLFNDMYFNEGSLAPTVVSSGLRAVLGEGFIDLFDEEKREAAKKRTLCSLNAIDDLREPTVRGSVAPHAVYTVSGEGISWCAKQARMRGLPLHIHLSETADEVRSSMERWGRTPAGLLSDLGALGPGTIAAHCVHLSDDDISILSRSGTSVSHQPSSNMKLSVGGQLRYPAISGSGTNCCLGTDGAASNNSLDMFQAMRAASLLCRHGWGAGSVTAREVLDMATVNGYTALGLDGGVLRAGALADIILLDLDHHSMVPPIDLVSNVVHSATGDAVRFSIIAGRVVMEDGTITGAPEILKEASEMAMELMGGGHDA